MLSLDDYLRLPRQTIMDVFWTRVLKPMSSSQRRNNILALRNTHNSMQYAILYI